MRAAGIVLAAGAGRRFGGGKMLADLGGRPLLAHVLATVGAARLTEIVVVLGRDHDRISAAVDVAEMRVVVNPRPERGLSSSLRLGLAALGTDVDAALILLGDQPRLPAHVISRLLEAEVPAGRLFVVPRYLDGDGPNPALVLRAAWPLADRLRGDHGLGRLIAAQPELVVEVSVRGGNPDIDTPADLAALERGGADG